jgi:hypothetical protein
VLQRQIATAAASSDPEEACQQQTLLREIRRHGTKRTLETTVQNVIREYNLLSLLFYGDHISEVMMKYLDTCGGICSSLAWLHRLDDSLLSTAHLISNMVKREASKDYRDHIFCDFTLSLPPLVPQLRPELANKLDFADIYNDIVADCY